MSIFNGFKYPYTFDNRYAKSIAYFSILPQTSHLLLLSSTAAFGTTETIGVYHNYIKGLLIIYLIVAVLNSVGLYIIGIKQAIGYLSENKIHKRLSRTPVNS